MKLKTLWYHKTYGIKENAEMANCGSVCLNWLEFYEIISFAFDGGKFNPLINIIEK